MNFDLGWFLTVPGLLITGGALLLVIALIIITKEITNPIRQLESMTKQVSMGNFKIKIQNN